jgi:DNA-binding NarL/FixJ family response regulator
MALRAAGMVEQDVDLLGEAVAVLEVSSCRMEYAHALIELGAALRRRNSRAAAREYLRHALDVATRAGAVLLAARAREELAASGARARRELLSGVESLTASERRVANLAAAGHSNPQIAQALFVTRKTVEAHLRSVYLKLNVAGRGELATALKD